MKLQARKVQNRGVASTACKDSLRHARPAHTPFRQVNNDIWADLKCNLSYLENVKCERPSACFDSLGWCIMDLTVLKRIAVPCRNPLDKISPGFVLNEIPELGRVERERERRRHNEAFRV